LKQRGWLQELVTGTQELQWLQQTQQNFASGVIVKEINGKSLIVVVCATAPARENRRITQHRLSVLF
jgi:hypothetical protein